MQAINSPQTVSHGTVLSWIHFGDLHMTRAGEENHHHFAALVAAVNRYAAAGIDFALLPGDNADNGTADQYGLIAQITRQLRLTLHVLPGDHDFEQRNLDDFYRVLGATALPHSALIGGYRCLFLDVVSAGAGGPDFRLDHEQLDWIERELVQARELRQPAILFMHTYPADLRAGAAKLQSLIASYPVRLVDMGHTHYNELSNDGHTIYATTRSTGQREEGEVGFSIVAVDEEVVSWGFKPLATPWPFVQITTPADHRMITNAASTQQVLHTSFDIRAKILGAVAMTQVTFQLAGGTIGIMEEEAGTALWKGRVNDLESLADGLHELTVQATDRSGAVAQDTIIVRVSRSRAFSAPLRQANGSDADAIGSWPEKHIHGTQLGPNKNGRHW